MKSSTVVKFAFLAWGVAAFGPAPALAAGCSVADFGGIVDQTAAALRDLNVSGAKRFQAKLATLRAKNGLAKEEIESRAAAIQDEKVEEFNREIDSLVNQMDGLASTPNNQVTCQKLDELKRVRDRLLTVMGQKSGYMLARADVLLDKPSGAPLPKTPVTPNTPTMAQPEPPKIETPPTKPADAKPADAKVAKVDVKPSLPERRPSAPQTANNWTTEQRNIGRPPVESAPTNLAPPPTTDNQLPPLPAPVSDGYSVSEIRDAGRGLFGTITAEFAGAIDFAFGKFGQPTAFITGGEGGGAFLAGLRYGKGTLHRKGLPDTTIYWQGPSAGLDLGAEGSRALFLVYNMHEADQIYGRFSGIGGSAYVAGGVGINVLGKDGVVMVPIRSGVGLRLGANLAYLKFTDRATWNPF